MPRQRKRGIKGAGSVYLRKSDNRYVGSFMVEETGRRKYIYADTEKDAWEKLQQAQQEQKQGILATGPRQTVNQYLTQWFRDMHGPHLGTNSLKTYETLLKNHILPTIGHLQLQKLTTQHVQALYARKMKEGYAAETIHGIHKILHRAFEDAVRWKLISVNVCGRGKVTLPRLSLQDIQTLTREQAQLLLEKAKGHWYLEGLLTLAIATGMRKGEMLALRWQDINFSERSVYIQRSVARVTGKGLVVSKPKTEKSKRRLFLPQFVMTALEAQRARHGELRDRAGKDWQEQGLVFCDESGGFIEPIRFHRHFKNLLQEAGLPDMRIHDLRHSAATILLEMGVNPKLVQELLGHSNIKTTMDRYSHVLPSMQRKMMDDLDQFFKET